MGAHTSMATVEREVMAETEDERTALACIRGQRHYKHACPICRVEAHMLREGRALGHRDGYREGYERGYEKGREVGALVMQAETRTAYEKGWRAAISHVAEGA